MVEAYRRYNFEETGVMISYFLPCSIDSSVTKTRLSSFWKLTALLFGKSVNQNRYSSAFLWENVGLAARLTEAAMFGSLSPSFLWEQA